MEGKVEGTPKSGKETQEEEKKNGVSVKPFETQNSTKPRNEVSYRVFLGQITRLQPLFAVVTEEKIWKWHQYTSQEPVGHGHRHADTRVSVSV